MLTFHIVFTGPSSSCHEHWHQHSCSALLAHSPQSVKRARAVFPPCSCALIMDNSSQSRALSWGSLTWSPGPEQETELRPGALCHLPLTQQRQKQRVQLRERGMSSWSSENSNGSSYRWSDPESPTRRLWAGPELGMMSVTRPGCDQAHPGPWPASLLASAPSLGARSLSEPDTSHHGLTEAELTKHQHRECKLCESQICLSVSREPGLFRFRNFDCFLLSFYNIPIIFHPHFSQNHNDILHLDTVVIG